MRSVCNLALIPVWLHPSHLVSTARIVMAGHGLRWLVVFDGSKVVGLVSQSDIEHASPEDTLEHVAIPPKLSFDGAESIQQATRMMVAADVDAVPVIASGRVLGVVTSTMLLREHEFTWDPHTELSRSDRLRFWVTNTLEEGTEVSLLFFDLNFFKQYNQLFGHVVGDRVLSRVARFLASCLDESRDVLVRYGGDEFAVGTTRLRDETEALAREIKARADAELIDEHGMPITFCIGISGGRRTGGVARSNVPVSAIYDDLVNAASQACMSAKAQLKERIASAQIASMDDEITG